MNLVNAINAATVCAAKGDIRYYLNGIALYLKNNTIVAIAGNDGHRGCVVGSLDSFDETVIIDRSHIKLLLAVITEEPTLENAWPNLIVNGTKIPLVEGRYPDIRRVIPVTSRLVGIHEGIGVNTEYLSVINKVRNAMTKGMTAKEKVKHQCRMCFGGANDIIRVDINELDTVMVISPMRL